MARRDRRLADGRFPARGGLRPPLCTAHRWRPFRVATVAITLGCGALAACDAANRPGTSNVGALPRLVAEAEMRIGDVDDLDLGFSMVSGVDVDRDGNVYVMEALVPEIRVFTSDGDLLRRLGRRGEGPGEFKGPPRFGVVGDTVWALTMGPDRITLFGRDGTLLSAKRSESVVVPLPGSYGYVVPWTMRPDGKFVSHLARLAMRRDDPPTGVQPTDSIPVPFVLFEPTGEIADTIGWAGRPPPRMWSPHGQTSYRPHTIEIGGGRQFVPQPPVTTPSWLPLPDGYVLVESPLAETDDNGAFTVTRFGLAGDTVYTRTLHYLPVRYSSDDLDSIAARAARGEAGGGVPYNQYGDPVPANWEAIANRLRLEMDFPDFKPAIEYPWIAQDESVWLRVSGGDESTGRWIVLDPQGRPRGTLDLLPDLRILWSRGDAFWAVEPDATDVPWVVRYHIRPG